MDIEQEFYFETINWGNILTLQVPHGWIDHSKDKILSISAPDNSIALNASAFKLADMNIDKFSELRFDNIYDYLESHGSAYRVQENNYIGWAKEFVGIKDGEEIFYFVLCLNFRDIYVSMTFTSQPAIFKNERELVLTVLESIKFLYGDDEDDLKDTASDFSFSDN